MDIDVDKERPEVHVTIPLKVQVLSIPSTIDYAGNEKNQELLKNEIRKNLEEKTASLIKKHKKNMVQNLSSGMKWCDISFGQ